MSDRHIGQQTEPQETNGCQQEPVATQKGYQEKVTLWLINTPWAAYVLTYLEYCVVAVLLFGAGHLLGLTELSWFKVIAFPLLAMALQYRKIWWPWASRNKAWLLSVFVALCLILLAIPDKSDSLTGAIVTAMALPFLVVFALGFGLGWWCSRSQRTR